MDCLGYILFSVKIFGGKTCQFLLVKWGKTEIIASITIILKFQSLPKKLDIALKLDKKYWKVKVN